MFWCFFLVWLCCFETLFVCRFYYFESIPKVLPRTIIKLETNSVFISPFPFSCSERKEPKDMKAPERVDELLEGRYYFSCLWLSFALLLFVFFFSCFDFSLKAFSFVLCVSLLHTVSTAEFFTFLDIFLLTVLSNLVSSVSFLLGCYFEGDQKMHAPGTTWHPFVPPFGYIKCAVCTCKVKHTSINPLTSGWMYFPKSS